MTLEEIIKKCKTNDLGAQEELYNLYKDVLFVLSIKYCKNIEEAEDNLQNTFLEIFTSIKKYNNTGSFEGWMKRITINKAIDSYKNSYKIVMIDEQMFIDTDLENNELDYYSLEYILSLIQNLPPQYKLVFCLFELDNYSHNEIAAMLSISQGTSKSNLNRAKKILKTQLQSGSVHNKKVENGK